MKMGRALTGPESGLADLIMDYVGLFFPNEYKDLMVSHIYHYHHQNLVPTYLQTLAHDRTKWRN